jgi:hypothetical protein
MFCKLQKNEWFVLVCLISFNSLIHTFIPVHQMAFAARLETELDDHFQEEIKAKKDRGDVAAQHVNALQTCLEKLVYWLPNRSQADKQKRSQLLFSLAKPNIDDNALGVRLKSIVLALHEGPPVIKWAGTHMMEKLIDSIYNQTLQYYEANYPKRVMEGTYDIMSVIALQAIAWKIDPVIAFAGREEITNAAFRDSDAALDQKVRQVMLTLAVHDGDARAIQNFTHKRKTASTKRREANTAVKIEAR